MPAVVFRVPSTCISSSNEVLSYRVGWSSCAVKLANLRPARSQMTYWEGWPAIQLYAYRTRKCKLSTLFLAIISVTVQLWI